MGNSHAVHDATHTKHNTMRQRTVEGIATLNAKREKTLYTTTLTVSKLNGLEISLAKRLSTFTFIIENGTGGKPSVNIKVI